MAGNDRLRAALEILRRHLDQDLFPLEIGDAAADRRVLKELRGQLDDYLLPRLAAIDAPLLAVVGGSTGAGKSTLVNSLVGTAVTEPGCCGPPRSRRPWCATPPTLPGSPRR